MNGRLLDGKAVDEKRGRGRTKRYEDIAKGLLPRPIKLGRRMRRWPEHEIDSVIAAEIAGKGETEICALVAEVEAGRTTATANAGRHK